MEEKTKVMLVNMGDNKRIVPFLASSRGDDAEALSVAIQATFSDVLLPGQTFFLQLKSEEWGGAFIDLLQGEIPDKSVIKAVRDTAAPVGKLDLFFFRMACNLQPSAVLIYST